MTNYKQILSDILTSRLQDIKPALRDWGDVKTSTRRPVSIDGEIHFNYQRNWLDNHQDTIINVYGVPIAKIGTLPRPNIHIYKVSHDDQQAYQASKVLENLLYYQFNLEVTRDDH